MRKFSFVAIALLLAACGSGGLGGLGDLGGILGSPSQSTPSDVTGTVNSIDTSAQLINLDVNYVNNLRTSQNGQSIYYNSSTKVEYQNRTYRVEDLERGDQISIRGYNDNGRYVAQTITVTRNVRG